MRFYNVKTRSYVEVAEKDLKKKAYKRTTSKGEQVRYAVRANVNGTNLTKFISKSVYDSLNVPVEL
jgi:hypothetical protein